MVLNEEVWFRRPKDKITTKRRMRALWPMSVCLPLWCHNGVQVKNKTLINIHNSQVKGKWGSIGKGKKV